MFAEIISIGDELLIGQVINTNASWMAQHLNDAGISVNQISTISDDYDHIINSLKLAAERADIIIMTGGLGPTKDDITKKTLCDFFDTKLIYDESVFQNIVSLFGSRGLEWNDLNRQQAFVPENCQVLENKFGTAPGMWFEQQNKVYISLPGVPFEMKSLLTETVIPELKSKFDTGTVYHKTVYTQGIPESILATRIEKWENNLPEDIKLAYLPRPGMVRLRLSTKGSSKIQLEEKINIELQKLEDIIPGEVFGGDEESLEEIIGLLLKNQNKTVSTAESCTGGYISHLFTSVAGSSEYFKGSVVAYSNEIKESMLGVSKKNLIDYGAVSEQVVFEMAEGARLKFSTDYAIATSGVAGPGGGTEEKPVGTTWIAVSTPQKTFAKKFQLGDHRGRNIQRAAFSALNLLRKELKSI